jgi:ribosomal-protein-alanine N-acetyltransferase
MRLNHLGTKTLQTGRLTLRPFSLSDAPAMFANWACDPEVTRYLTWPTHTDAGISATVLADWVPRYAEPTWYQWAIVPRDVGEPIGSIAAVRMDENVQSVHVGYCIGRRWWRMGYTSEALAELLRFFFEEAGALRVDSRHDPRNPASGAVMRRCGMTLEGTMRQADRNNQGICDCAMYGVLRDEYVASKAAAHNA